MKKIKLMLSEGKIEKFKKGEMEKARYNAYLKEFGEKNLGLIQISDIEKEIFYSKKTPIYEFDKNLNLNLTGETGIDCELFLASGFEFNKLPSRKRLEKIFDYIDLKKDKGEIKNIVNSKESTLYEDKASFVDFYTAGLNVPETLHFEKKENLVNFLKEDKRGWVIKHRFGSEGQSNYLVNKKNLSLLDNLEINDFVVQEEMPIISESRFIFFENELIGTRLIEDRTRPWENKKKSSRKHEIKKYFPSKKEIEEASEFFNYLGPTIGAIDMVNLKNGKRKILEFNGISTGFGYPKSKVYDLNNFVFRKLREKYFE